MVDIRGNSVDELVLARAKHQAEALMNADAAEGHIALSAVAALRWDVVSAEQHVNAALRSDSSVSMLCNAVTTFEFLNRSDLARPHAIAAGMNAPFDVEIIQQAITSLLSGGYVRDAARLSNAFEGNQPKVAPIFNPIELLRVLDEIGINEDYVQYLLSIAHNILTNKKKRAKELGIYIDNDPDGSIAVAYEIGFIGNLEDEFALEEELIEGLDNFEAWDPTKMTVHFKYLSAENVCSTN